MLIVAGCADVPPEPSPASARAQSCEREYRVGSMLPVKHCVETMTDAERQLMLDQLQNSIRSTASKPPGGN
jgi:hypothetical protein